MQLFGVSHAVGQFCDRRGFDNRGGTWLLLLVGSTASHHHTQEGLGFAPSHQFEPWKPTLCTAACAFAYTPPNCA